MNTYQDLLEVPQFDTSKMDFVLQVIRDHQNSAECRMARIAEEYASHRNVTINNYQKLLYTVTGQAVPDNYSANHKMASDFFDYIITQENQYLLGNGVNWGDDAEKYTKILGKNFDTVLQDLGESALVQGVSFAFFDKDRVRAFKLTEFAPLYDEETSALRAGVRFWQIDESKPLRATLYEEDGFTEYIWRDGQGSVLNPKTPYITLFKSSEADGTTIYDYKNYPSFPIIPLWGNKAHQSELVGKREQIDCFDLIKSGYANDMDDASLIYWTIQNAGGMDEIDMAEFVHKMRTLKVAKIDDDKAQAESHTIDVPYQGKEALLTRLQDDLFRDAMALDVTKIASGNVTATQIKASYEPLDEKTNKFEYCVLDFLDRLFLVAGIEDARPTFTRSRIMNTTEEVQNLIASASYLTSDYITRKLLNLFGDGDMADDILKEMTAEDVNRLTGGFDNNESDNSSNDETEPQNGANLE